MNTKNSDWTVEEFQPNLPFRGDLSSLLTVYFTLQFHGLSHQSLSMNILLKVLYLCTCRLSHFLLLWVTNSYSPINTQLKCYLFYEAFMLSLDRLFLWQAPRALKPDLHAHTGLDFLLITNVYLFTYYTLNIGFIFIFPAMSSFKERMLWMVFIWQVWTHNNINSI